MDCENSGHSETPKKGILQNERRRTTRTIYATAARIYYSIFIMLIITTPLLRLIFYFSNDYYHLFFPNFIFVGVVAVIFVIYVRVCTCTRTWTIMLLVDQRMIKWDGHSLHVTSTLIHTYNFLFEFVVNHINNVSVFQSIR